MRPVLFSSCQAGNRPEDARVLRCALDLARPLETAHPELTAIALSRLGSLYTDSGNVEQDRNLPLKPFDRRRFREFVQHARARLAHVVRETMSDVERRLDRVKELQPWFRGDYRVVLHDGAERTMTKTHREKLESRLLPG